MALHIIIDGYNLIYQSKTFNSRDMQDARDGLVNTLAAYKRMRGHTITVVFDGAEAPPGTGQRDRRKGINVTFSRNGELADAVIKRMAAREKQKALVVSSDREIVEFAASQGATTIDAALFEEKISMAALGGIEEESTDSSGWTPTTRKKGPRRRLPKRERRNRTKIRKL